MDAQNAELDARAPEAPADATSGQALGLIMLLLGGCAIGTAPILVRLAGVEGVGPSTAAFWRMALALPGLMIWASLARAVPVPAPVVTPEPGRKETGAQSPASRTAWMTTPMALAAAGGVFFAGDLATWHAGIVRTTAANATLLANLTPVIIVLGAWLALGRRPTLGFAAGLAAALVGIALLSGAQFGDAERRLGDLLCALTAVWYAAYMLVVRRARQTWPAARVMMISTLVAVPILFATALIGGETLTPPTMRAWILVGLLGAGVHVFGQGAIAFGLGRLPAALSSLLVLVQPIVAASLGWRLFGEALGPWQILGAVLALLGLVIAHRASAAPGRLARGGRAG